MLRKLLSMIVSGIKPVEKPKKNQWVAIGICFVLAVTLWFLVTINTHTYITSMDIPLKLINFPENYQLIEEVPKKIKVELEGTGSSLLNQEFTTLKREVVIDFLAYQDIQYFVPKNNLSLIDKELSSGLRTLGAYPDSISLKYLIKANKTVPLKLDITLNLPPSYRVLHQLRAERDSVLIVGPKDSLEKITEWHTQPYVSELIKGRQDIYIPLDTLKPYQVLPKDVVVTVNPRLYTEKKISVPIDPIFLPRSTYLNLKPDSAKITILVPLEDYETVSYKDFRLEVDYRNIYRRTPFVIPEMSRKPNSVEVVKIEPEKFDYMVMIKEE